MLWFAALGSLACAQSGATQTRAVEQTARAELRKGPLESYLPSPGLCWLLQLKPRNLLEHERVAASFARLVPEERREAFLSTSGVDLTALDELWIGEYELGRLTLFTARNRNPELERKFVERSSSARSLRSPHPELSHWTALREGDPVAFVRVGEHLVAFAERDPSLAKIVRAYATKKLSRSPPALESLLLAPLREPRADDTSALRFFAVAPFSLDDVEGALSQDVLSLELRARAAGDQLEIELSLLGAWDASGAELADGLTESLGLLLDNPSFRALHQSSTTRPLQVECHVPELEDPRLQGLELCRGRVSFSLSVVLDRLERLLNASTAELLER